MELRSRFYIEAMAATAFAGLSLLTLVFPNWIEGAFGVDFDQGGGALELMIVAVVGASAVACSFLARGEWRRAHTIGAAR